MRRCPQPQGRFPVLVPVLLRLPKASPSRRVERAEARREGPESCLSEQCWCPRPTLPCSCPCAPSSETPGSEPSCPLSHHHGNCQFGVQLSFLEDCPGIRLILTWVDCLQIPPVTILPIPSRIELKGWVHSGLTCGRNILERLSVGVKRPDSF